MYKIIRYYIIGLSVWMGWGQAVAQSNNTASLHDLNHYLHQRSEIITGTFKGIHSQLQPISREDIVSHQSYVLRFGGGGDTALPADYHIQNARRAWNYTYIRADYNDIDTSIHSQKPFAKFLYPKHDRCFLRHFYQTPANFWEVRVPNFYININPILHLQGGVERYNGQTQLRYLNRRGARIQGNIANRVYFYTDVIETQVDFPTYVNQRIQRDYGVPSAGFFKQFDSSLNPAEDTSGIDYLLAQGYVSFDVLKKHIGVRFGHGQHFIGDGHRSLFLSDFSTNYFYLQLNTRVWKIHYQNIFAELTQNYGERLRAFDLALPKKYMAAHYLSINITRNFNIGLFENIIFSRGGQFDLQYLNPLILYRSVEQAVGSPDNVVMGLSMKWNVFRSLSLYGQFLLDELSVGDLVRLGGGWWGNKFAAQFGVKYINAFKIDQLDLQAEFNIARPYTYAFRDSSANYTHYNQPLAHPLGANFYEIIGIARYHVAPGMRLRAQVNYAVTGRDEVGTNWGTNPNIGYNTRSAELNNFIGQGITTRLLIAQLLWEYQVRHNLSLEAQLLYRSEDADLDVLDNNTLLLSLGLRWNITARMHDW